jgi:hypothetical protein
MYSAPFFHSEACFSYHWQHCKAPIYLPSSPTGGDLMPHPCAFSVSLIRRMIGSIQVPMHMSKNGSFRVRALRYMTVHDMFSEYSLD